MLQRQRDAKPEPTRPQRPTTGTLNRKRPAQEISEETPRVKRKGVHEWVDANGNRDEGGRAKCLTPQGRVSESRGKSTEPLAKGTPIADPEGNHDERQIDYAEMKALYEAVEGENEHLRNGFRHLKAQFQGLSSMLREMNETLASYQEAV